MKIEKRKEVSYMVKTITAFVFALLASVAILGVVSAQEATSTPSPSPTPEAMAPSAAPSTGFGN